MKLVFKKFFIRLIVVSMLVSLTACSSSNSNSGTTKTKKTTVTISLGMPAGWVDFGGFKSIISDYERKTGNTIEVQSAEDTQFDQLIMAKLASGTMWDMFARYTGTQAIPYNAQVNCVDLSNQPWVSRITSSALPTFKQGGKVVCAPFAGLYVIGVVYNKTVFSNLGISIPKTTKEFEAACAKIKAKNITPIYVSGKDGWTLGQIYNANWPNIWVAHPDALTKLNANKMKWSDMPEFVNMFTQLDSWTKNGFLNKDALSATYDMQNKAIANGSAAMAFQGDWAAPLITAVNKNAKIGMFPYPTDKGDNYLATGTTGGIYISKKSKYISQSKDFLSYISSPSVLKSFYDKKPDTPAWKDVTVPALNQCAADAVPLIKAGKSKAHYGQLYVVPWSADQEAIFQEVIGGSKTPIQAAKGIDNICSRDGKQMSLPGF